ncbi:MAG: IS1634 family transposase [Chlamydiae bacterium]|nr:IS1634 family transposase [Chlamydiota bacterium]
MFIDEIVSKKNGKKYKTTLIRETFREKNKVLHRTIANISKLPDACIEEIKRFFKKGPSQNIDYKDLQTFASKEYGASWALLSIIRDLGIDSMIFSKKIQWREDILAMIIGRIIYPGSKLLLTHLFSDTVLWELCGHPYNTKPDVQKHCYGPLDLLLKRQEAIQNKLAKKHLEKGCVVLFDITSTYFEGEYEDSEIVTYGYNRDRKRGFEQVNIGLLTDKKGCPIATETFAGNIPDQVTVQGQAKKISNKFNVKNVIFVGDRGMLTPKRIEEVNAEGFQTITALTHKQMENLLEKKVISLNFFQTKYFTVVDPENSQIRYVLCFNPQRKEEERQTRLDLIKKVEEELGKIPKKISNQKKSAAVGKIWKTYPMEKFFTWTVENQVLTFSLKADKIAQEEQLDGCYIIRTDVPTEILSSEEVVKTYKKLAHVEKAFRIIKTTVLEIRPVRHHLDNRIKAHIFLCMLPYYLQWHICERLGPLLKKDGTGQERRYNFSLVLERLKALRSEKVKIGSVVIEGVKTRPDQEQTKILDLLRVAL